MTAPPALAVVAAPRVDEGVREFLRVCVGLVAGGGALTLVEVGCGRGVLSGDGEQPAEIERQLEGLAAFDAVPRPLEAAELRDLLAATDRVLRIAAPTRRGTPEVVRIDGPWLLHVGDEALVLAFEQAGQILRA